MDFTAWVRPHCRAAMNSAPSVCQRKQNRPSLETYSMNRRAIVTWDESP